MKKFYTFAALLGLFATANAQTAAPGTMTPGKSLAPLNKEAHLLKKSSQRGNPTSRWYSYGETMDLYWTANAGSGSELNANFLFPDTTILVEYSDGFSGPWIHNLADVLDVSSAYFNDPSIHGGELVLNNTTPYRVDSLGMLFLYTRMINDPSIVDTLIFEVGVNASTTVLPTYYFGPGALATNLGTDTVFFKSPRYSYTTNTLNHVGKKTYKIPLTEQTYMDSLANGLHYIEFATPDLPNVNAGKYVVMSAKFKPGYQWIANYDTLANKNSVRFVSYEEQPASYPLYTKRDYNASYIVPQDGRYNNAGSWNGFFIPSFAYMGSSPSYAYEHHAFYYKVSTQLIGINETANNGTVLYQNEPNPANNTTTIRYSIEKQENVRFTVQDVTGRIVKVVNASEQGAGMHAITLDASEFNKGVYFYTLTAGAKSYTKRMVIAD